MKISVDNARYFEKFGNSFVCTKSDVDEAYRGSFGAIYIYIYIYKHG